MLPHVYTIPPDRSFLTTLAGGLVAQSGGEPLLLPRMTVLLPTRRAVRSLRDAFLRITQGEKHAGAPLLLPRMRAIGDLDSDELSLSDVGSEDLAVPPPIPELRRRFRLPRLVLRWAEAGGGERPFPG